MKYQVIDYFDVWTEPIGEEDGVTYAGFTVNDLARTDYYVDIEDSDNDKDILVKLAECGYLNPSVVKDCKVESYDPEFIEVFVEEGTQTWEDAILDYDSEGGIVGDYPLCRLEIARDIKASTRLRSAKIVAGKILSLEPREVDKSRSFYNKAKVQILDDGGYELLSYDTPVAQVDANGEIVYADYGVYSQTTDRHIREFIAQFANNASDFKSSSNWKPLRQYRR